MRANRWKITHVVHAAALWWKNSYGRRIKAGSLKEAIRTWNRGRFKAPDWLTQFVCQNSIAQPA
jgi:hypothetical protein